MDINILELTNEDLKEIFKKREKDSHKGTYGYVGIIGGCMEYTGAIKLASMSSAALRAGCGVIRVIVPKSVESVVAPYLLEQTIFPIENDAEEKMKFHQEEIDMALEKLKAIAIGMGWGKGKDNEKILEYILQNKDIPCIIDADGLNTLSQMNLEILQKTNCKVILTPHLKEFERLSKIPMEKIKENPIEIAKDFADKYQVILLLKGSTTIVTDGINTYLVKRGCPGMATAGSGDVLSGILVGMLGYQEATVKTIAVGSYLAGIAGELAQEKYTDISMKASDTIEMIPEAIKKIRCLKENIKF